MSDKKPDALQKLMEMFNREPKGEVRYFYGTIEAIEDHMDIKRMVLHVKTGRETLLLWIPTEKPENDYEGAYDNYEKPLQGDSIEGYIDVFGEPMEAFGGTSQPIFDFKNISAGERRKAQEYFRRLRGPDQP